MELFHYPPHEGGTEFFFVFASAEDGHHALFLTVLIQDVFGVPAAFFFNEAFLS